MELPNGMTMLVGLEWISGRLLGTLLMRLVVGKGLRGLIELILVERIGKG